MTPVFNDNSPIEDVFKALEKIDLFQGVDVDDIIFMNLVFIYKDIGLKRPIGIINFLNFIKILGERFLTSEALELISCIETYIVNNPEHFI